LHPSYRSPGYIPANYIDNTPVEKEKVAAAVPVAAVAASAAPVHVAASVAAPAAVSTAHHQQRASMTVSPLFASALAPSASASASAAATSLASPSSSTHASALSLMPLPSADQHLLRFRETLGDDWAVAKTQTESGAFYTKRLCSLAKHLAQAEEAYAQAVRA
jgi:hypothetical protein